MKMFNVSGIELFQWQIFLGSDLYSGMQGQNEVLVDLG